MNKQLPIIAGGIVILAVIGVVAFLQMGKKPQSSPDSMMSAKESQSPEAMTPSSLLDLFKSGKNTTCKFSYPDGSMNGTVYVSGNKVRDEFKTTKDGKTTDGVVIYDGTYLYFWSSSSSSAFKYKIDNIEKYQEQAKKSGVDMQTKVNFDCAGGSVDASKFVPPADVTFKDFTQTMMMMEQKSSSAPSGGGMKPSCESITDPAAKAACMRYSQ